MKKPFKRGLYCQQNERFSLPTFFFSRKNKAFNSTKREQNNEMQMKEWIFLGKSATET